MNPWSQVSLDEQIQHFFQELGWNWAHPRVKSWIQRCEFSHPKAMSDRCKASLVNYLFEVQAVLALMRARGLDSAYLAQWMAERGFNGVMPLQGYVALRRELEALEEDLLF